MRYLAYILILINLGYFAWYQYQPKHKPAENAPAPLPAGIKRLVLLSERPTVPAQAAVSQTGGTLAEPVEPPVMVTDAMTSPEQVDAAGEVAEEKPAQIHAEAVRVGLERVCWAIGPLRAKGDIASISELLKRHSYQPVLRGDKLREPAGYWVYMPAMPARDARRIVADLEQRGMKDYYIGRENHISLGIFSTKAKARVRLKKVKNMGYDAVLDQRYRNRAVFWLDVGEQQQQPLPDSQLWKQIQAQHENIQVQRAECEQFAQQ